MANLKESQQENQPKNPRNFVVSAVLLEINRTASIRAMPLAVINGLPAAEFRLGDSNKTEVPCRFHLDSCSSMNTGNRLVRQWLMTKYPDTDHRYEQFDNSNLFEPIISEGELNVDSAKEFEADKLTATMTYNTCYNNSNGEPFCITFGHGATVSVNAIIGIPTLTAWKMILYLDENRAFSKTMQLWFPLSFLDASVYQ